MSGCSIVPGMHVSIPGGTEKSDGTTGSYEALQVKDGGPLSEIRIVTLTPRTIAAMGSESRKRSSDELPAVQGTGSAGDYQIGPSDVVNVIVWDHPELTNPVGEFRDPVTAGRLVDAAGMMYYPYIGQFKAAGMNVAQLRDFISQNLSRVISKPQVDVRVVAFRSRRVRVSGEVRQPGVVALDDTSKGIIDALGERGGLTENASRRHLKLTRNGRTFTVDFANLLAADPEKSGALLQTGDYIHVPDRSDDQVFVLGEVNKEGPIYLREQRTTLVEALTQAGGLNRSGSNDSGVLVFRRPQNNENFASVYRVSISDAVGLLVAGEFPLEPRDIVYVSSTAFSEYNSVINQLLPTISAVFQLDALVRQR